VKVPPDPDPVSGCREETSGREGVNAKFAVIVVGPSIRTVKGLLDPPPPPVHPEN
jgi:hypothetical protein